MKMNNVKLDMFRKVMGGKVAVVLGILFLLIIHLLLLVMVQFTAWPEMMLWPYLLTKGWLPYRDIAMAHNPLLVVDVAIFYKLFGAGLVQLKLYTWLLIVLTDLVLFEVARRLWNSRLAILALAFYIPLQVFYEGNGLWFDLALAPFALFLFYLIKQGKHVQVGIFWALAFLVKQTAFWFLFPVAAAFYMLKSRDVKIAAMKKFVGGAVSVAGVFVISLYILGIFKEYWFWAVEFGVGTLPRSEGQIRLPDTLHFIKALLPYLTFLPLLFLGFKKHWLLFLFAIAAAFGAYPRWELFHYQPSLPFVALGFALTVSYFNRMNLVFRVFVLVLIIVNLIFLARGITRSWGEETRFFEPQLVEVANYINDDQYEGELMYVFDYWDNLYPLTGRVPATRPWVPTLAWYVNLPGIEEKMLLQLEENKPPVIVSARSEKKVYNYGSKIEEFINENYNVVKSINGIFILERALQ
jgi:hypothetical protein